MSAQASPCESVNLHGKFISIVRLTQRSDPEPHDPEKRQTRKPLGTFLTIAGILTLELCFDFPNYHHELLSFPQAN